MRCDEVQHLHGPYIDFELDAKSTLEIEQHLKTCPDCARIFAEEEKLDARIMAGLNRSQRTAALWEKIECSLATDAPSTNPLRPARHVTQPVGWHTVFLALGAKLHAGGRGSFGTWAGLAVLWVVILGLNFAAREPDTSLLAQQAVPSASEMRFALKQRQVLMAELAVTSEPAPADKPKAAPPSPRSDRRNETLKA